MLVKSEKEIFYKEVELVQKFF